ncbi:hypothetical protein [Gemmatimonas sp.]|uniref:hypothetical protein n=1 Tax=Gemmatimonas sp. TaxID=1962908 RepID=UPI003568C940
MLASSRQRYTAAVHAVASVAMVASLAGTAAAQTPRFQLELEAGPAWISRNVVQIPNNATATRFSLNEVTGSGPWPAGRAYFTWNVNERHGLRALAAPLSITETGRLRNPVSFAGGSYTASAPVEATYAFNSYRLTYRYQWRNTERTRLWVGFTGKIRDATVQLAQGSVSTRKDDLGFVPLLHVAGEWRTASNWQLGTDIDALAGGPGRAIDAAVKLGYDPRGRFGVHVGYRTVEGGADVDEVYSFSWIHYAVASLVWRW